MSVKVHNFTNVCKYDTNNTKISKDFLLFLLGPLMDLNKQNKNYINTFLLNFL